VWCIPLVVNWFSYTTQSSNIMVRVLDSWLKGRGRSRLFCFQVTTLGSSVVVVVALGKLFTHICLCYYTHTHTRLTALFPGLPGWAGTRQTLLQTDSHASTPPLSFYRPDALPAAQPTASKHWRHIVSVSKLYKLVPVSGRWSVAAGKVCRCIGHASKILWSIQIERSSPFLRPWTRRWINQWAQ